MIRNILEYLEKTAKRLPDKIAFSGAEGTITFAELEETAKRIGTYLTRFGGRSCPIAVMMQKTPVSVAAFLGVVYSGNFYTPIDVTMPKERVLSILHTLRPQVLLIDEKSRKAANHLGYEGEIIVLEEILGTEIDDGLLRKIHLSVIDTDPLYALFTSGSTGVPKGVVISHQAVVNLTEWYTEAFSISDAEIIGNQAPFYFDSSVKDLYALCIVVNTGALENFQPSYLKKIMFCGEAMPTKQFNQWREKYPDAMFANIYGPTETTVDCTYYIVDRDFADDEPLPIGYGCRNTDVFLLNGDRLAAEGESGELCVRGRCLALGYYNNPEKTAEAFIQNPLNPYYPEKIYKTGDIAKYNERGEIVFLARKDHQIKHMGHRIELGEIETAVNSIGGIETGVCLYDEGTQRILLFYCGTEETTQAYILKCLRDKVPKYMFPNLMLKLEKIPQTLNGKIDRLALKEYYDNDKQNT